MSRHSHTLVAVFLVACCCFGTVLIAQQRDAEAATAAHVRSHGDEAKVQGDAGDSSLPTQAPTDADVPAEEA